MKLKLSNKLSFFIDNLFSNRKRVSSLNRYIVIGIGGNVGNTKRIFQKLIIHLKNNKRIKISAISPILKNPPFGFLQQRDFLNAVILLDSDLSINQFFKLTSMLELRFKRERSFKNAPRTLDIDIIFFKNKKIKTKKLIIPHKFYKERESVILPLKSIINFFGYNISRSECGGIGRHAILRG